MSKLLIVDDDIRLRKLVRTYGEVEHYECDEAADGLAALEKLQNDNFDLVILDVMMPGLDGFETLERIRKISEIPVIMLTARNEEYDKLTGFGLNRYPVPNEIRLNKNPRIMEGRSFRTVSIS